MNQSMSQAKSPSSGSVVPDRTPEEKLGRLPPGALENYRKFMEKGDEEALTGLVIDVLNYYLPKGAIARTNLAWPEDARLVEDLGFDSLATIETVFFIEDLFQISIANDEIMKVRTVGDLRRFLRGKIGAGRA
jgi:acyl carrier protein